MDRRRFLLTSLAGVVVAPLRVGAQQEAKIARIGYLALNLAAGDLARPRGRSFPNTGRAPATDVAAPSHSRAGVSPSAPAMSSTSTEETPMSQWPSPCLGRTRALWAPVRPPASTTVSRKPSVPLAQCPGGRKTTVAEAGQLTTGWLTGNQDVELARRRLRAGGVDDVSKHTRLAGPSARGAYRGRG
jgi:hypothetical protein